MKRQTLGAVLAGGGSRRFGGDKAMALLGGRTLLDHVATALQTQTDQIVVCGRSISGRLCLEDWPRPGLGPLGGLAAALRRASRAGFDAVLSAPCDTPILPRNLGERLAGATAAIVAGQPLIGFWPVEVGPVLESVLESEGDRSVFGFARTVDARELRLDVEIANINRPDDLRNLVGGLRRLECEQKVDPGSSPG